VVEESQDLANEYTTLLRFGEKLVMSYSYKYGVLVETQLQKGGWRLAKG